MGKLHEAVRWTDADGIARKISYPAVRNYHYDRDPPAFYMARVCKVFGVNHRWLLEKEGPRDSSAEHIAAEEAAAQQEAELESRRRGVEHRSVELHIAELEDAEREAELEAGIRNDEEIDQFVDAALDEADRERRRDAGIILATPAIHALFSRAWKKQAEACPDYMNLTPEQLNAAGTALLSQVEAPLQCWGFAHDLHEADRRRYEEYAAAMLLALSLAVADPGQGDPIDDLEARPGQSGG